MIIDNIKNLNLYSFSNPGIIRAFDFIMKSDIENLIDGRYDIDGDNVYALVNTYETKLPEACFLEAHKKYVDVQFVAKGKELLGYMPFNGQKVYKVYDPEKDFMLFDEEPSFIKFTENMFAILFPADLHMPGINSRECGNVRKVVVKVRV
ncbi:MAG: YhcH/YjgK/YiaL family protein [Ignavibacteriae bacterium]|nr:YhcH/YjgK/YiaL family protein [Ignavibacteriota bacterium]